MRGGPWGPGLGQGQPGGPGPSCSLCPSMAQGSLCLSREALPGGQGFVVSQVPLPTPQCLWSRGATAGFMPGSSPGVTLQPNSVLWGWPRSTCILWSLWRDSCNLERFHRLCPGPCSSVRNKVPNKHVLSALLMLPLGMSFLTRLWVSDEPLLLGPRVGPSASSLQTQLT